VALSLSPWRATLCCLALVGPAACTSSAPRRVDAVPLDRGEADQEPVLDLPLAFDLPRGLDAATADRGTPRPDGAVTLAAACKADADCSAGLFCKKTLPRGMCTRACASDAACGAGSLFACQDGLCRSRCNIRLMVDPCRVDYACQRRGTRAVCMPRCQKVPCGSGLQCDATSGLCINPKGGRVGARCGLGVGDCSGTPNGICFAPSPGAKAFCTVACAPFARPCPFTLKGAGCLAGSASGAYCMFTCDPKHPVCPHKDLKCIRVSKHRSFCLPP